MQQYIHKYFTQYRSVSVPGIGSFDIETQNAKLDFIDKTLHPPVYVIRYNKTDAPDEKFYHFLSKETGVDEYIAIENYQQFSACLKEQLEKDHFISLEGIGTLTKNASGYSFAEENTVKKYFPAITAERIIRQNAEHTVKVGEDERTSTQMHEQLQHREIKEDNWFVHALVLAAIGIAAIAFHYLIK